MKQLILALSLAITIVSCRKEVTESVTSSISSNETLSDGVTFYTTPLPLRIRLIPTDRQLIDDSFYVSSPCVMKGVTLKVFNYFGNTQDVRLRVDGDVISIIHFPQIVEEYNILSFIFTVNVPLQAGYHRLSFRGNSSGPTGINVHFHIQDFYTAENLPVYNLPVDKRRKYNNDPQKDDEVFD